MKTLGNSLSLFAATFVVIGLVSCGSKETSESQPQPSQETSPPQTPNYYIGKNTKSEKVYIAPEDVSCEYRKVFRAGVERTLVNTDDIPLDDAYLVECSANGYTENLIGEKKVFTGSSEQCAVGFHRWRKKGDETVLNAVRKQSSWGALVGQWHPGSSPTKFVCIAALNYRKYYPFNRSTSTDYFERFLK